MNEPEVKITDNEAIEKLLFFWKTPKLNFIGKLAISLSGDYFFNEVELNEAPLLYPDSNERVSVFCPPRKGLEHGVYYSFTAKLADKKYRNLNPYKLIVDINKPIANANEYFVRNIFKKRGRSPGDAATIARQLKLNELELYTQTERFIFELIQNADDMPREQDGKKIGVLIDFVIKDDYFVFLHSGLPFEAENVEAISDASKSTKAKDTTKTGYKGIGFKSVFTDAKIVFIHSGGFSFRFDKTLPLYNNFYQLYSEFFNRFPEERPEYVGQENYFTDINNVPWQIKPVWTNKSDYPEALQSIPDFFNKQVSIALKIGMEIILNKNYNQILKSVFLEPRFILFLRNVRDIAISSPLLNIRVNVLRTGYLKSITSSDINSNAITNEEYITDRGNYQIKIANTEFERVGVPIVIHTDGDKSSFKKTDGTDINSIPEKLAKLDSTTISFAAKIKDEKIVKLPDNEAILFNYLPTNDSRFGFPFLVNGDFITTTNRETIIQENPWNIYLFYHIGYYSIRWIADTALIRITNSSKENLRNSILGLLPKIHTGTKDIHVLFNKGLQQGIDEIAFIPSEKSSRLLKANEAVLDNTNLFKKNKLDYSYFKELFPEKELINCSLLYTKDKLCSKDKYGFEVASFEKSDIKKLYGLEHFQPKLKPVLNAFFLTLLQENEILDIVKEFPSLQNSNGELRKPSELFIYADKADRESIAFDISLSFIHDDIEQLAITNEVIKKILLSELGVRKFDSVLYIQSILPNYRSINRLIGESKTNLLFWKFIFRHRNSLSDNDKVKLQNFLVSTTENKFCALSDCFLSSEYDTLYPIENIAVELGLTGMNFVSISYLEQPNLKEDFRRFFYSCKAKPSEGWSLYTHKIKELISSNKINENNHKLIVAFIFNVFRNNRGKFADKLEKNILINLRLLTVHNGMQKAFSCIFSNPNIAAILPEIALANQVNEIYQSDSDIIVQQEWKEFFLACGVTELTESDVVKRKFDKLQTSVFNKEVAIKVWRFIFSYSNIFLADLGYKEKLKEVPVLLKNDTLKKIRNNILYLSSEYLPSTAIEELLLGIYSDFISPLMPEKQSEYGDWKKLFTSLGIHEQLHSSGAGPNYQISHSEFLNNFHFATKFWEYFQKHFVVNTIHNNSHFRDRVLSTKCIPCLDGILRMPGEIYPNNPSYINSINDNRLISAITFSEDLISFLGMKTDIEELEEHPPFLKYIGNLGEKHVYESLKSEFASKGSISENDFGFTVINQGNTIAEIIWNNKPFIVSDIHSMDDSGNPFDISIIENKAPKLIEVKTTLNDSSSFMMPESEWNCMLTNSQSYYIYRVSNAIINPSISSKYLAIEALVQGKIKPLKFPVSISI